MKKIIAFLLSAAMLCIGMTALADGAAEYKLNLDADGIASLGFSSGGGNGRPLVLTDAYYMSHFEYKTSKRGEIEYVTHMLNSMTFIDDGRNTWRSDDIERTVQIEYSDGGKEDLYFAYGRLYRGGKQYASDEDAAERIFDNVYGFKTGKTVLPETIDFASSAWAEDEIGAAVEAGLLPEEYRVNYTEPINRIDACRLLDNLTAAKGLNQKIDWSSLHSFDDIADNAIHRLYQAGIIDGKSETEFAPYDLITREETAKIISRAADALGIKLDGAPEAVYNDSADISDWAKTDISKVTNAGLMNGYDGGFRPKDNITRQEFVIILLRLSQI